MISVNVISETVKTVKGHGVHSAFVDMTEALKRRDDVTVFVNSKKKTDITHIHTTGPYAYMKSIRSKKTVISAHLVPDSLKGSLAFNSLWLPIYTKYLIHFYNTADLLLANSPYTFENLKQFKIKTTLEFLPLGVNRSWFFENKSKREALRKKHEIPNDKFVVVSIGQIQPRKGVSDFINVAKKLPDVTFVWVGGTPFGMLTEGHRELEKEIEKAPPNCKFIGEVDYKDVPEYYAMADMFFMPSHQETFGLVITEAASCGLPLLLRDIPIYKKLFAPHYEKASDIDGFIERIVQIKSSSEKYSELKRHSEELAEKYNWDSIADKLVEKYKELLQ